MQTIGDAVRPLLGTNQTRKASCDTHGEYISRNPLANIWTGCPACAGEAKASAEMAAADSERMVNQEKWARRLGGAGIPLRFQSRTIPNFVAENDAQRYAVQFAVAYAAEFGAGHSGRCAIFIGEPGTGKTHLACGIAMRAMKVNGICALFTTVGKMARRIREGKSFDSAETESQAIAVFTYPDLLIIDEIGVQSGTDAESRALFDVINDRYEACRPTIFLSNLDVDGVRLALGERIFDRIREDGGEVVVFDWGSWRGRVAA